MGLNKTKGNMYSFISHTWNPIKGRCEHDCIYCYMKKWGKPLPDLRLDEKDLKTDLGKGNFIFVGSGTDMFCKCVSDEWRYKVLYKCKLNPKNRYLFQTKNPLETLFSSYPYNTIIGITLETNRDIARHISMAPLPRLRVSSMQRIKLPKMVTIEPIMDFDLNFVEMIKRCNPEWVNIGADSNRCRKYDLPEPTWKQVEELIGELSKFTEVKLKKNLNRLKNENYL